jgi:SAV_6107-like HEPN
MFEYKGGCARTFRLSRAGGQQPGGRGEASRPARPQEVEDVAMNTIAQVGPDRVRCRVAPSALALLESARQGLVSAEGEVSAGGRYVGAHLAALRAAAAIVAAKSEPAAPRRRRPLSVWELLPRVEPTLNEWAAFFAAGAGKRAAAEAGLPRAVTPREAEDLLRDASTFVALVETALGVPAQSPLPLPTAI